MMSREVGDPNFSIWLLGDSNPERWQALLKTPLDPRHPIRHNIWTSVLDVIQDRVFRERTSRVETSRIYIRNAVDDPAMKPTSTTAEWEDLTLKEVATLKQLIHTYQPALILCFGAFSFEFVRRALEEASQFGHGNWTSARLGNEFRRRISEFRPAATNVLPLLHRSIAGGKFIESHDYFCGQRGANYFEYVGCSIAELLLQHHSSLRVWVD